MAGFVAYSFLLADKIDAPKTDNQAEATTSFKIVDPCDLLTQERADGLLGKPTVKNEVVTDLQTESDDVTTKACEYRVEDSPEGLHAKIIARSPRTTSGKSANEVVFKNIPQQTNEVKGYGEGAYWNQEFGQLNILNAGVWYTIEIGKESAAQRSEDQATNLAGLIKQQL